VAGIDRWFGASGLVPLPEEILKGFFAFTLIEHAQIPPENQKQEDKKGEFFQ
jgi:polar amino acid transport system substrate-binding protein